MRILPSEVRRTRLQGPQKARETGAMMPISPMPSSKVKRCAVSPGALPGSGTERTHGVDARVHLVEADDGVRRPDAVFFERHELDEADDDAFAAGELGEGHDLVVVEAAQQDAVDLDRAEAGGLGGADAGEHALVAAGDAGDAGEVVGIDGVHADGDAGEAGVAQRLGRAASRWPLVVMAMSSGWPGHPSESSGVPSGVWLVRSSRFRG